MIKMYAISAIIILVSVFEAAGFTRTGRYVNPMHLHASTTTVGTVTSSWTPDPPNEADLTPAVDKYMILGVPGEGFHEMTVTAKGPEPSGPDPFKLVKGDVQPISDYIKTLVQSENPVLTMAAQHFFKKRQGKQFRPTIVALMARALSENEEEHQGTRTQKLQIQLGQITEMIHVASLIHDDVLDDADMRRGGAAVHTMYTNKVAVLAGDYLLARASVLLARLQNFKTVEVMASALDALVQGEIMQARSSKDDLMDMKYYLRKSYFKTASLICSSCKSTALLAGYDEGDLETISAERYGYHLGMAYQIVDDILDFTGASASLGKPAQADMELGLATAPILFASESVPELTPLIKRRFKEEGDVQRAVELATATNCVDRAYKLADFHAQQAVDALMNFPASQSRSALLRVLYMAISRDK